MHRLVRISPFNAEGKRQTSFAAIDVSPEINENTEIELRDEDIREDVFRASGGRGAARQQNLQCHSPHAFSQRHRRSVSERAQPTQEPRHGNKNVACSPRTDGRRKTRSRPRREIQIAGENRLRFPNSQLLSPSRPAASKTPAPATTWAASTRSLMATFKVSSMPIFAGVPPAANRLQPNPMTSEFPLRSFSRGACPALAAQLSPAV